MGGIAQSASFALTTGCGAMITLSTSEISALGLVQAQEAPIVVPTLSSWSRLALLALVLLIGGAAIRRQGGWARATARARNLSG